MIDGCPSRLALDVTDIQPDLDRRRPGQSRLVTQRDETDQVEILSGVVDGLTLGSPIALLVRNKDQNSGAYDHMKDLYRPSHADFTTEAKYGIRAVAGGGRASARETIGRVAAAAVARKLLAERFGIEVDTSHTPIRVEGVDLGGQTKGPRRVELFILARTH